MKLAPVVPPGGEWQLPTGLSAHFCFANVAWTNPGYRGFYRGKDNLVVDCPIYEGLEPLEPAKLLDLGLDIRPEFLIIPDARHSLIDTLKLFDKYRSLLVLPGATGVLQGRSLEEIASCVVAMASEGLKRFALPKDLTMLTGVKRSLITEHLFEARLIPADSKLHWLGGNWPYNDHINADPRVLSFDTAEPFNAALRLQALDESPPPDRPANWWTSGNTSRRQLLRRNIQWIRSKVE